LSIRGRGRVWIEWDSAEGVATALHYRVILSDEEAVWAYKTEIATALQRFGRKVPLLICLDGITGQPAMLDLACRALGELAGRFAKGVACYGEKSALRMFSSLDAMRWSVGATLHETRWSALASVKSARRG
jgi:hypothetical protein